MGLPFCSSHSGGPRSAVKFVETPLAGAYLIEFEPHGDARGRFVRVYCADEYRKNGLDTAIAQCSISTNHRRGTLRGMHFQAEPHGEAKTVRCIAGSIFDVIVDIRIGSPTRLRWHGVELTESNQHALYIPVGFAHGFLTLEDESAVEYQISRPYVPESVRGIRWNDPAVGITWPFDPGCVTERDASFPPVG
jgi:dTDP-4-dehydrorhamnose 3,5-epimerase